MTQKLVSCGRDRARSLPSGRGFLLIPLILVCFALTAQAAPRALPSPSPDGCYPGFTTAEGCNALLSLTTGAANAAFGWFSLSSNTTGNYNTGLGGGTLVLNNADSNTAAGAAAMLLNTKGSGADTGTQNCAYGTDALVYNAGAATDGSGSYNDAVGAFALFSNTDGFSNNAFGNHVLWVNLHGAANTGVGDLAAQDTGASGSIDANYNTAVGYQALRFNDGGDSNNAIGAYALQNNDSLENNAMGVSALQNNTGSANTAIGDSAFVNSTTGSYSTVIGWQAGAGTGVNGDDDIYIGATSGPASGTENGTIRIGDTAHVSACYIAGIFGAASTGGVAVLVNSSGQLGTAPAGSPFSMNNMLKQQRTVEELKAVIALQAAQIKSLTASLKEQATQIQKVSAQLEMIKPAPQVVENR
jgi:hypothetical protein